MQENQTEDTEILEIKSVSLVDATLQTAKKSFSELVKETPIDKKAKELKSQLKKLEIQGIDDKENYNKVKAISKDASKVRIAVEKRRKELKADIILAGKQIDTLANEYQALINPVENEADAKLKVVDDLIEAEKARKEREDKERTDKRKDELEANGLAFTGQWWTIGEIQVGIQQISEMSEEEYPKFLEKVKVQNEKNIAAKAEQDRIEKERLDAIEKQRLENEELQRKLREQQEAIERQKAEMQEQQQELERKQREQREAEHKAANEAKERQDNELIAERAKRFELLGFKFNYQKSRWEMETAIGGYIIIDKSELLTSTKDEVYEKALLEIENIKKAKEQREELDRIERERLEQERQDKIKKDAEIAEAKRLSLLDDTAKYQEWTNLLLSHPAPTVSDSIIQLKINTILEAINQ